MSKVILENRIWPLHEVFLTLENVTCWCQLLPFTSEFTWKPVDTFLLSLQIKCMTKREPWLLSVMYLRLQKTILLRAQGWIKMTRFTPLTWTASKFSGFLPNQSFYQVVEGLVQHFLREPDDKKLSKPMDTGENITSKAGVNHQRVGSDLQKWGGGCTTYYKTIFVNTLKWSYILISFILLHKSLLLNRTSASELIWRNRCLH